MPIKFHCQHCDQLLGISRSRAGAVVDCPQCGRSLRVPELDGRTRKLPKAAANAKTDSGLMSALSELSALGTLAESDGISESYAAPAAAVQMPQTVPERIAATPIPLERIEEDDRNFPDGEFDDGPYALTESLEELAHFGDSDHNQTISDDLLTEMKQVSEPSASPLLLMFGGLLLTLCSAGGGWWMGRTTQLNAPSPTGNIEQAAVAEIQQPNRQERIAKKPASGTLSGTITFVDSTGTPQPDSGSLVLLLPAEHTGSFRLHARAFRKGPDDSDRIATLAALSAIGGAVTTAAQDGSYQLDAPESSANVLVIISRHQRRPNDVPLDESTVAFLESWFDSTSHMCGQLAVKVSDVEPAATEVDFSFE